MDSLLLDVQDLTVTFGEADNFITAVDNISFNVSPGEVFGLVGESGSGKSTILRAVAGLNPDWSGKVKVAGENVGPKRSKAFYKQVQMVFQDPYGSLHPRKTVHATLAEPLKIHELDNPNERISKVLEEVGLEPVHRFRYPHQLSGGQRQRVAVARSLILKPKILLLDEPTSALDVSVQAEILNLLTTIREIEDLTYVLVSHDLGVITHMCNRIAVMKNGEILEELSVEDLVADRCRVDYTKQLLHSSLGYTKRLSTENESLAPAEI